VAPAANLVLNFNETVVKGSGTITISHQINGLVLETIDVASDRVTVSGNSVTIDPVKTLALGKGYAVEVPAGAFEDAKGNDYAGLVGAGALKFTVLQEAVQFTGSYSQNFDTLASSGTANTWANGSTLQGWSLYRQPAASPVAVTTYGADSGATNSGAFVSYGASGGSDRAFGSLASGGAYFGSPASGAVAGWLALAMTNDTGAAIAALNVSFSGEQWRNGGNTTAHSMVLEYGYGSSFGGVTTWIKPGGSFNWTSPVATGTAAAVDGNAAGKVSGLGGSLDLAAAPWAANGTLWLRWIENNDSGNDHGLAIDDLAISAQVAAPAAPLGVGDLVFLGANADPFKDANGVETDAFAFAILKNVAAGTKIGFTDRNYSETTGMPATGESAFLWTADQNYAAGTIVTIRPDAASGPLADKGTTQGAGGGLSATAETVYAFLGDIASLANGSAGAVTVTQLLASLNLGGAAAGDIPASISATSVSLNADNARYNGVFDFNDLPAFVLAVDNPANWQTNDATAYTLANNSLFPV
jgi:hypothetical protein